MYQDTSAKLARLRIDREEVAPPFAPAPARVPARPARRSGWLRGGGLAAAACLLAAGGYWAGSGGAVTKAEPAPTAAATPVAPAAASALAASGHVVARRHATLAAQVTGQILAINVAEGDRVSAGQVIARLDASAAAARLANARATAQASAAGIAGVAAERDQAERVFERYRELSERGFARRADLEESQARLASATARLHQARAAQGAEAALIRSADVTMGQHVLRAPFAATVVSIDAQPGEMISPMSAGGFTRTGIATLVDMASLEVEAEINESHIARVRAGQAAEIVLDAFPGQRLAGRVVAVIPSADRARGSFTVRIALPDHRGLALPNMAARIRIMAAS